MDIVVLLYEQAREIAKEGHNGWGNTMVAAAEEIEKLRNAQQNMHPTPPTSLTDIALARAETILAKRRARKSAGG